MHLRETADSLADGEVHVWVARPGAMTGDALRVCAGLLSPDEREHVARFRFERHRREALVSRALVRMTLSHYLGRAPSGICYRVGPHGRPDIDPPCGLDFNATNHPGLVACALSREHEIGIDTEPLARGDEILEVAEDVFSHPELDALGALESELRRDRAVSLWTCKEAYIKARGLGFSASLREIVVDFPDGASPRVRFLGGYDDPCGWWLTTRDVMGFRIAVALRSAPRLHRDLSVVIREATWDAARFSPLDARPRIAAVD